ncbi:MAG TPA: sigma-70 family RNA polymerase sigma factor [Kofleriaceae bacterium]|nr:sigma-70 family RNA polymerase sigma factor [Kofleriaceae bacterium]
MPERATTTLEIRRSFDEARAAWPAIEVPFEAFADRVASGSRGHAADLYLACALSAADPTALAEFDQRFLGAARDAVARIDGSHDFVAEVQQTLRERLLVGPRAKIRDYRGAGALAGWVRTAAVRTALNLRRNARREIPHAEPAEPADRIDALLDPEIAMLRRRHGGELDTALRRAIAALGPRDRLLLQFYYVDGLTLARIAAVERVGTSTVFRRLNAATRAVLAAIKRELVGRLQLSADSLDSLIRHVQDDIDLSLSQVLGAS